jgi:hypothetical protein
LTPEAFQLQMEPFLPNVAMIRFLGGEPLLEKSTYSFLEYLIERRMTHIPLYFQTNFSVMSCQGRDAMELWNRFERVCVAASLDGMGPRGEYLRKGQDWDETLRNRQWMFQKCPRASFRLTPTLHLMNSLHIPDFHREWIERGYVDKDDPEGFILQTLRAPACYSAQALPERLKRQVVEKYRSHLAWLLQGHGEAAAHQYRRAITFIEARDRSAELEAFRRMTIALDLLRGERFEETFPELSELISRRPSPDTRN